MRTIPIYIFDGAKIEENETLGFEKNKCKPQLISLVFSEKLFAGFWVDYDIHDDTKTVDIIFYVGGCSFRTPYDAKIERYFIDILK